ncbi:hypothetical protein [Streptomyces sp. NPDC006638]|uniref:hypothetical protein n=1 Tax=Streptomyces sp. NPDC006638 TaxID=3157183 RepID=UPI0033B20318
MKQRIEFTGFVTVYTDEPLTSEEAYGWVESALLYGDKHADRFVSNLEEVTSFSSVGDDE